MEDAYNEGKSKDVELDSLYPPGSQAALMTQTVMVNTASSVQQGVDLKGMLKEIEQAYIREALSTTQGVVSSAAKQLGLKRTTLIEKIKKYNIG